MKPNQYNYIIKGRHVTCSSGPGAQTVMGLWEAEELSDFHDADLARATKEINAIVDRVEKSNENPKRTLSLIRFQNRHLMVWAHYDSVTPYDDEDTIIEALKLRKSSGRASR